MIYLQRIADKQLCQKLDAFGAVLIIGPKGCGKTTTAKQAAKSFIEFQDEDKRENLLLISNTQPSDLLKGKKPRLFDEWQDAPKIWGAIRKDLEYWTAWSLAYYQWLTSLIFAKIDSVIPITQIYALYHPYHEMDILQFVDRLNELFRRTQPETELEVERQQAKLPQDKLAKLANISVKTIQQYEQCQKDINQAPVYTLYKLAKVLHCSLEDLIEKVPVVQPGGGK